MSEDILGTVVANVLRNSHVDRVLQENETLREAQTKAARLEITGGDGTPLYASADIRRGIPAGNGTRWHLQLELHQASCALSQVTSIQITLGGVPLLHRTIMEQAHCGVSGVLDFISGCFDQERFGLFEFHSLDSPSIESISVRCGPFANLDQYRNIDNGFHNDNNPFRGVHMRSLGEHHLPAMSVRFEHVDFKLPEMLGCLERFGISKERATAMASDRSDSDSYAEME